MKTKRTKVKFRQRLNLWVGIVAIVLSVWSLVIGYRALDTANWVDSKQNNIIERYFFQSDN